MGKLEFFYTFLISLIALAISINIGSPLTFFIFILILIVLILSFIYPKFISLSIDKLYLTPLQVYKNQHISASIKIKNLSFIPVIYAKVRIIAENIFQEDCENILFLKPYSSQEIKVKLKAVKRGYVEKIKIFINPSLFFEITPPITKEINTSFYIYPNFANIKFHDIVKINPENNISSFYKLTEEGEFFSIRDYNMDDVKKIAWKQWAKTGKPVVKQRFQYSHPKLFFVINNFFIDENNNEEFVEKINTFFKYLISNNIEINVSTLENIKNFKKISDLRNSLVFLSTLNFITTTVNINPEEMNNIIFIVNKNKIPSNVYQLLL